MRAPPGVNLGFVPILASSPSTWEEGALSLSDDVLVRVDIPDPQELNLRIPSGNEAGANDYWIPRGRLPDGAPEAVIDAADLPESRYTVRALAGGD